MADSSINIPKNSRETLRVSVTHRLNTPSIELRYFAVHGPQPQATPKAICIRAEMLGPLVDALVRIMKEECR